MPIPTILGLPPDPSFQELVQGHNKLVREITNLFLTLDTLNVISLSADVIDAGMVNANVVTIRSDLTGGAYVQIDGNGMVINNGAMDTFRADVTGRVTMTGALIQSKPNTYPMVVMDPQTDLFGAYQSPTSSVRVEPRTNATSTPGVVWDNGISSFAAGLNNNEMRLTGGNTTIAAISSLLKLIGQNIELAPNDSIKIPTWHMIKDSTGKSAADVFAAKGAQTGPSQPFNGGIPIGTVLKDINGVPYTWTGIPAHTHTQN